MIPWEGEFTIYMKIRKKTSKKSHGRSNDDLWKIMKIKFYSWWSSLSYGFIFLVLYPTAIRDQIPL